MNIIVNKKRVYLAGKMTGLPFFNFPAFFEAEAKLKALGYEVFNPARHDVETYGHFYKECPNGTHEEMRVATGAKETPDMRTFAKTDLNWIIDNADAIALLPTWQDSKGARCEKALADWIGLEVINL